MDTVSKQKYFPSLRVFAAAPGLLALANLACFTFWPAIFDELYPMELALGFGVGALLWSVLIRNRGSLHLSIMAGGVAAMILLRRPFPQIPFWPCSFLFPILLHLAVNRLLPATGRLSWWRSGELHVVSAILWGLLSSAVLFLWCHSGGELSAELLAARPTMGLAALTLAALGFAIINGVMEEVIWRGVFWESLSLHLPPVAVNIVQAFSFGIIHFAGIPSGWSGVGLATVFGLILGYQRLVTGGLKTPLLTHFIVDLVVFSIVMAA